MPSFYRRTLPDDLVDFSSPVGKQMLRRSLDAGTAEAFFRLIANLHTQGEPSWCGLGTLVTVLNALQIDPGRTWKGDWRWFGEELLDCCTSLEQATTNGLTLQELATIAHCNGAHVDRHFATPDSLLDFRTAVQRCVTQDHQALIIGYHRAGLQQTGSGHYSPIGAWDAQTDHVLILDVARFKYPPHWAPLQRVWQAMTRLDETSGQPRGWLTLRASGAVPCRADVASMCCKLRDLGVVVPDLPAE
jgi:glutathione gamma-glutamylcysteinyltransferase